MRSAQWIFFLILALILSSCSLVNTAYSKAPELVSWWLDDYFDFTQQQKNILDSALHRLHTWHRESQLPTYLSMLKDMQRAVGQEKISSSEVCNTVEQIKLRYAELQQASVPIIVEVAPLLSDKQLQYFRTKLDKRAEKWKSEWLQDSVEEQLEARFDKAEDYAEKVYGSLDDAQRELLKQSLAATSIKPALTFAEIQRRNDDAYQIMTAIHNPVINDESRSRLVKDGFARLQKSPNLTYQTYADQMLKHSCEIISNLHASTNAQQKQHARDFFENYISQLSGLVQSQAAKPSTSALPQGTAKLTQR